MPVFSSPRRLTLTLTLSALALCIAPGSQAATPNPWQGQWQSGCQQLVENTLYFIDIIELSPRGERDAQAQYRKRFYGAKGCPKKQALATFHLPPSRWIHKGEAVWKDRPIVKVATETPDALLTATIHDRRKVRETAEAFVITYGPKDAIVPVEKKSEGGTTLELRLIDGDRLYLSNQEQPAPDQFPPDIDLDNPFTRQATAARPRR